MNIGKLRHQVELQNYNTVRTGGQKVKTWSIYDTIWAWIRPMSGKEQMSAQQPVGEITHKVTIRYHSAIAVNDRIKFGSRFFDINFIGNYDERNVFMEIMCREKV